MTKICCIDGVGASLCGKHRNIFKSTSGKKKWGKSPGLKGVWNMACTGWSALGHELSSSRGRY